MSTLEHMEEVNRLSLALSDEEAYAVINTYEAIRPTLVDAGYTAVEIPEGLTNQEKVSVLSIADPDVASLIGMSLIYGPEIAMMLLYGI